MTPEQQKVVDAAAWLLEHEFWPEGNKWIEGIHSIAIKERLLLVLNAVVHGQTIYRDVVHDGENLYYSEASDTILHVNGATYNCPPGFKSITVEVGGGCKCPPGGGNCTCSGRGGGGT